VSQALLFGCGTGRCGTKSLLTLLNTQAGIGMTQERHPLPWSVELARCDAAVEAIRKSSHDYAIVGDIAPWWLPYAQRLIEVHHARLIVLQRDRVGTVSSYLRTRHDCASLWPDPERALGDDEFGRSWWHGLPKFGGNPPHAARRLWDFYYELAEQTLHRWPFAVRWLNMDAMNNPRDQAALLHWVGIERPVLVDFDPVHPPNEGFTA